MAYTTTQLITNAYNSAGIIGREFETVQGYQAGFGLDLLNQIIAEKTINSDMIPYISQYQFFGIIGQESYFIPNLIELETITFYINNTQVRYSMHKTPRKEFFGTSRANNINSLPYNFHVERCFGGANVFLYFFPDQTYPLTIWGTFRLPTVTLNQDMASSQATFNMGTPSFGGTNTLTTGELVINGVDMLGAYPAIVGPPAYTPAQSFVNYINTGTKNNTGTTPLIPNVTAALINNEVILYNNAYGANVVNNPNYNGNPINNQLYGVNLNLMTLGTNSTTNYVSFYNFSTQNGPLNQTFLSIALDQFYIDYLRYELADRLCTEYAFDVPEGVRNQLNRLQLQIGKKSSPIDLHMQKMSTLDESQVVNYAQANVGRGWTT